MLVRDPAGIRKPQAFLCTDLNATPATILGWYVQRWSMETTSVKGITMAGPRWNTVPMGWFAGACSYGRGHLAIYRNSAKKFGLIVPRLVLVRADKLSNSCERESIKQFR